MSNFVGSLQYIGSLFRVDEPVPDDYTGFFDEKVDMVSHQAVGIYHTVRF